MIYLGSCVAPVGQTKYGDPVMDYNISFDGGRSESGTLKYGELKLIADFPVGAEASLEAKPTKRFDVGEGTAPGDAQVPAAWWAWCSTAAAGPGLIRMRRPAQAAAEWGTAMNSYADLSRSSCSVSRVVAAVLHPWELGQTVRVCLLRPSQPEA